MVKVESTELGRQASELIKVKFNVQLTVNYKSTERELKLRMSLLYSFCLPQQTIAIYIDRWSNIDVNYIDVNIDVDIDFAKIQKRSKKI